MALIKIPLTAEITFRISSCHFSVHAQGQLNSDARRYEYLHLSETNNLYMSICSIYLSLKVH